MTPPPTKVLGLIPSLRGDLPTLKSLILSLKQAGIDGRVIPTGKSLEERLRREGVPSLFIGANPGFGESISRAATQEPWEWLLLVNDDITFDGTLMREAIETLTRSNGPALVFLDPTPPRTFPTACNVFGQVSLGGAILGRLRGRSRTATAPTARTHFGPFSLVLLNRELWDRLDGFDPSLIYTFEDADFSRRAALMGADISFSAQVGAHHAASSTGRRHVDTVLPVAAWSASEYLAKWVMPRPAARAFCVTALTCRLAVTPVAGLPVRSHIRGIRRAIGALVTGRPPALPEFERM